jgi:hypothetical protein
VQLYAFIDQHILDKQHANDITEMVEAEEQRDEERKARAKGQEKKAKGHGDVADKKDESARKGSNQNEKDSKA